MADIATPELERLTLWLTPTETDALIALLRTQGPGPLEAIADYVGFARQHAAKMKARLIADRPNDQGCAATLVPARTSPALGNGRFRNVQLCGKLHN
jgi:hypothetical protein